MASMLVKNEEVAIVIERRHNEAEVELANNAQREELPLEEYLFELLVVHGRHGSIEEAGATLCRHVRVLYAQAFEKRLVFALFLLWIHP